MDVRVALGLLALVGLLLVLLVLGLKAWKAPRAVALPPPAMSLDTLTSWQPQATRLLTTGEREAFDVLRRAFPRHVVMAQVPLARFLRVPTRYSYKEWLQRVGHQCADLVLCDATTQVIAVVAVRTSRPQTERAIRRQARLAKVLKAAEIPLHLWVEGALPSPEGVRRQFGIVEATVVQVPTPEMAMAEAEAGPPGGQVRLDARTRQPAVPDEVIEMREPPNSTWFDDFDSRSTPLDETRPPGSRG
jgi:hypothetical protein